MPGACKTNQPQMLMSLGVPACKLRPDWAEAEADVEAVPHTAQEEAIRCLKGVRLACTVRQ